MDVSEAFGPLIERALHWLEAGAEGILDGEQGDEALDRLVDELAAHLLRTELRGGAWLDVGLWDAAPYREPAAAAVRLHTVAITGDELGLAA